MTILSSGQVQKPRSTNDSLITPVALLSVAVGVVFVLFNFSGLIRHFLNPILSQDSTSGNLLFSVLLLPKHVQSIEFLSTAMLVCLFGLWGYLAGLLVLAFVKSNARLAIEGFLALLIGIFSIPLLGWGLISAYWIIWLISKVVIFIYWIVSKIIDFILYIFSALFKLLVVLLHYTWPILIALVIIALVLWLRKRKSDSQFSLMKALLCAAGIAAIYFMRLPLIAFFLRFIWPILQWCKQVLGILFVWLGVLFKWLFYLAVVFFAFVMLIGILGSIGYLLIDQFRTAWQWARSRKGVILNSFAIGSSLSLIFMVSAGSIQNVPANVTRVVAATTTSTTQNLPRKKKSKSQKNIPQNAPRVVPVSARVPVAETRTAIDGACIAARFSIVGIPISNLVRDILPKGIRELTQEAFNHASAPTCDAVILALALLVGIFGLVRGLRTANEIDLTITFYRHEMLVLLAFPLLIVLQVFAAQESNQS